MALLKKLLRTIVLFSRRSRVAWLYHFRLQPRIIRMRRFVGEIAAARKEHFPLGKSLFVFPGKDDTLYFIIFKETASITVTEVYDEILNRIPERYQILPQIKMSELLVQS